MAVLRRLAAAAALLAATTARAGVPVIDHTNLANNQVNFVTQIANQVLDYVEQAQHYLMLTQQYQQLVQQLSSMNGSRLMGSLLRNPALNNYIPTDSVQVLQRVTALGAHGMTPAARTLRERGMLYDCEDQAGEDMRICQSSLGQPYQHQALLEQALAMSSQRMPQINGLLDALNGASDQAANLQIGARIAAEGVAVQHETSRAILQAAAMQNEAAIEDARRRERTAAMLRQTATIKDFAGVAP